MGRIIKTWRDPYDEGFTPTRPRQIEINPGLTILVGCNGAGKTTLLHNIESELKKEDIPCKLWSNLHDGGSKAISSAFYENDYGLGATLTCSSEGECISLNFGSFISKLREFLRTGFYNDTGSRLARAFAAACTDGDEKEKEIGNERWLLFDALDSGLSVDNIVDIIDVINLIIKDATGYFGIEPYIIISANEYELCRNNPCFDVNAGKYITFKDYEDYRKHILKSREKKDKRYKKKGE